MMQVSRGSSRGRVALDPRIETELGELPASWRVGPLGEFLSKAQYGASVKSASSGAYPILRMTNQVNGRISSANLQYAEVSAHDLENFRVQRRDILFNRTNSFELVGRTAIFDLDGDYVFASYLIRLRTLDAVLDPFFLNAYLNAHETQRRLKGIATRAVSQSNISASRLRTFVIPVPPIAEQRKIAAVLGLVQRAMEQQERLIAFTTEMKKALLHKLFTEGLRREPQRQTEIGPVPQGWEITELGKVVSLFGGYAFKSEEGVKASNTQLVRMGNLYQNRLDLNRRPIFYPDEFAKKYRRFVLQPGDLIMSLTGTSGKEDYGFTVALKPGPITLLLNQRIARVDLISDRLTKEFLLYFLLSRKFLDHLYPTAKGMKQANLSTHAMKRLKVPVPSVDEQEESANSFRTIDRKIDLHQAKLDSLRDLFHKLLHQLMTAQIPVDDQTLGKLEVDSETHMR